MNRIMMLIGAAALLVGCRSSQDSGYGGTGSGSTDAYQSPSSIELNTNLPGGDSRPNRDGSSRYGTTP